MGMKIFATLLVGFALAGCGGEAPSTTSAAASATMTRDDFLGYLSALQAHDYERLLSFYTEDYKAHILVPPVGTLTRDQVIELERTLAAQWDWRVEVRKLVVDEGGVALEAVMRGPLLQQMPDVPLQVGEQMEDHFIALYTLRGKKISEFQFVRLPPVQ